MDEGESLIKLFKDEELYYCHNDIKMGNFILSEGKLYTIDFEESDFNYMAFLVRSSFCAVYESQKFREKVRLFLKSFVNTFFDYKLPQNLQKELKFIFYTLLTSSIIKNLDKKNYEFISKIPHNIQSNIDFYKGFDNIFDLNYDFQK